MKRVSICHLFNESNKAHEAVRKLLVTAHIITGHVNRRYDVIRNTIWRALKSWQLTGQLSLTHVTG